ncbi:hypothetical protein Tco_0902480 [Tanacetum coccineum]
MAMDAANRLSAIAAKMRQLKNLIQKSRRVLNLFLRSVRTLDPALKEACIRTARERIEDLEGRQQALRAEQQELIVMAGPPSSLRSNPSRQLRQPVLIALALIPIRYFQQENKKGRNQSGEKGKWNSSQREGMQGGNTNKSEKGSKEGTHLDRETTGDRIWKEINMFSRTNRFTPSTTAHQENNGQSWQRQARMLLPTRPIQGNLTLRAENPSHFR